MASDPLKVACPLCEAEVGKFCTRVLVPPIGTTMEGLVHIEREERAKKDNSDE